jgi:hypothetical protein
MPSLKATAKKQKLIPVFDVLGSVQFLPNLVRRRAFRAENLRHAERILWVNVWRLGDLVLTTPALAKAKSAD